MERKDHEHEADGKKTRQAPKGRMEVRRIQASCGRWEGGREAGPERAQMCQLPRKVKCHW